MLESKTRGLTAFWHGILVAVSGLLSGCDGWQGFFRPNMVTVQLVNNGDFAVEGQLFYDDEGGTTEEILKETGTSRLFAIAAGDQYSFSVRCENLRAIMIANADLQLISQVGPDTDTGVLRDGDDFECGDRIIFTFNDSDAITDFDVTTSVQRTP